MCKSKIILGANLVNMIPFCLLCNLVVVVYVSLAAAVHVFEMSKARFCADGAFSCFQVLMFQLFLASTTSHCHGFQSLNLTVLWGTFIKCDIFMLEIFSEIETLKNSHFILFIFQNWTIYNSNRSIYFFVFACSILSLYHFSILWGGKQQATDNLFNLANH